MTLDDRDGLRQAVEHLVALGHGHRAPGRAVGLSTRLHRRGCCAAAVRAAGLEVDARLLRRLGLCGRGPRVGRGFNDVHVEHHEVLAGGDASMAPGFETPAALAASKASGDYWART